MLAAARKVTAGMFSALSDLGSARLVPPRDARDAAHRLAAALGGIARAHELRVDVRGEVPRGTALVVANHVSYIDPIAILPTCPAAPVAKGEVLSWPIVGPIGNALGVAFVRRNDPMARARVLRRIHDLLAAGVPVLNFAEGTTTEGQRVLPLHRGTFGIAQRLGVPVVPLALRYNDPCIAWCGSASFLPHYLRTAARDRIEVILEFGAPMSPRAGEAPEDMAARCRNAIQKTLDKLTRNHAGTSTRVSPSRPDPVLPVARAS